MRVVVATMAALLVAATTLAAFGAGDRRPRLVLARATVRGTHFVARERVTVKFLAAGRRTVRRIRASSSGRFVTPVPVHDPCLGSIVVAARGAKGDSARLKLPQRACPPPDRSG